MRIVALVPIKLNSQRLPHKNILPLMGKPLCWHVCNTLSLSKYIDQVYIYCSDVEIKKYIPETVTFLERPNYLDGNTVKGLEIYKSFTEKIDADIYVLAHTTSPFIKTDTIDNALEKVLSKKYDSAFSARRIQTFCWFNDQPINYSLTDIPRTQDIKPVFEETSAFFIFRKDVIEKNRRIGFSPYISEIDSIEAVDIDTKEDYDFARLIANSIHLTR